MTTEPEYYWLKPANSLARHFLKCRVLLAETTKLTPKRRYWRCGCGKTGWTPRY